MGSDQVKKDIWLHSQTKNVFILSMGKFMLLKKLTNDVGDVTGPAVCVLLGLAVGALDGKVVGFIDGTNCG